MNKIRSLLNIDKIHRNGITGSGVNVAVLDTGMYLHNDLKDSLTVFSDFVNGRSASYDDNSHGTHVCGIIGASGRMSGGLYKGIAPSAGLVPLKVLNQNGTGTPADIISGIEWILRNHESWNIRVVNISIGTDSSKCEDESSLLVKSVDSLWDAGLTVVTSAGNNGPGYRSITMPGISRKVITVGTNDVMSHIDRSGRRHTTYSGKGPTPCDISKPDIIAPGNRIVSCYPRFGGYTAKSGTSMSTPIVSGAAALAFSYNKSLTNDQFKSLLCRTADDIGLDRYTQGCGRINILSLLLSC
ncbi:MAG: S8 family peptidase [Butyrivibrio sp.]|nr:S8 family peptidase [Butyrivibrio sp.]